jgi:hypothetical protein
LNFASSTYKLTVLPFTSVERLESEWQARQSALVGVLAESSVEKINRKSAMRAKLIPRGR